MKGIKIFFLFMSIVFFSINIVFSNTNEYSSDGYTLVLFHYNDTNTSMPYDASSYHHWNKLYNFGTATQSHDVNPNSGWTTNSKVGDGALNFDGTDDAHVLAGSYTELSNADSGPMTIEMWVLLKSLNKNQGLVFKDSSYILHIDSDNKFKAHIGNGLGGYWDIESKTTLTTNQWYHLAVSWDSTNIKLYINGSMESNIMAIGRTNTGNDIYIGVYVYANKYLHGTLDEVRFRLNVGAPHHYNLTSDKSNLTINERAYLNIQVVDNNNLTVVDYTNENIILFASNSYNNGYLQWGGDGVIDNGDGTATITAGTFTNGCATVWVSSTSNCTVNIVASNVASHIKGTSSVIKWREIFSVTNNSDSHTVLLLHFDETNGNYAYDSSDNNYTNTLLNFANTSGRDVDVDSGWTALRMVGEGALHFDGNDDYVYRVTNNSGKLDITNQITLESWVYLDDYKNGTVIGKVGAYAINIITNSGKFQIQGILWVSGSPVQILSDSSDFFDVGEWHHVAFTYDRSYMRLYLDGNEIKQQPQTGSIDTSTFDLQIGYYWWGYYIDGKIDELQISDIARTNFNTEKISKPYIINLSPDQRSNGNGIVDIFYIGEDLENHSCNYIVAEYSTNNGTTWYPMTRLDTGAENFTSGGSLLSFVWDAKGDIVNVNVTNAMVRLQVNNGYFNSDLVISSNIYLDFISPIGIGLLNVATNITPTSVDLFWNKAVDNREFGRYEIYYGTSLSSVTNRTSSKVTIFNQVQTNTTITGLQSGTTYYFKIWAYDRVGNELTVSYTNCTTKAVPPQIKFIKKPSTADTLKPIRIEVMAIDNLGIKNVNLFYRKQNESQFKQIKMTLQDSINKIFRGDIPRQKQSATILYYVAVTNNANLFTTTSTNKVEVKMLDDNALFVYNNYIEIEDENNTYFSSFMINVLDSQEVNIKVYDLMGREVRDLSRELTTGTEEIKWDLKDSNGNIVDAGIYIIVVSGKDFRKRGKLIIVK